MCSPFGRTTDRSGFPDVQVLHLSTYDRYGGAALAANRLHQSLLRAGLESQMLVRQRRSQDATVTQPGPRWLRAWLRLQRRCDRLRLGRTGRAGNNFSIGWVPGLVRPAIRRRAPDIVHAHWISDGFVRLESLVAVPAPLVWTLHDLWALTGGCHYPGSCSRFRDACGQCPVLGGTKLDDLSREGWERRRRSYAPGRVHFVAPSRWMAAQARASSLLAEADVRVIPNGIDLRAFAPIDRRVARQELGLPMDRTILLAGAAQLHGNPRKGIGVFCTALAELQSSGRAGGIELAVFGAGEAPAIGGLMPRSLGVLRTDAQLARAYAAADVFVLPSLEDNLPNTAIEAMAVGTPVVGFAVGGVPEIIDDGVNGLLAASIDAPSLAAAIHQLTTDRNLRERCSRGAREKAESTFSAESMVAAHRALYEELAEAR